MKYRIFGKTGEKVSVLGYGNMRLPVQNHDYGHVDVGAAMKLVRHAVDNGVNYTECNHCSCPHGVFISCCFSMYNSTKEFELNRIPICEHHYGLELKNSPQEAARCNDCGECSWQCPQGIDIPTQLRKVARHFANVKVGW